MRIILLGVAMWAGVANAHLVPWHNGMYCRNGTSGSDDQNTADIVTPLYQLTRSDWWFHHVNGCDQFPPAPGQFLELPAGGDFTVEIASNRGETTLSFDGQYTSEWPDGGDYPEDYNVPTCITSPNMHTQNETNAAGTAFAISYESDITKVTEENLVVFSVRYHTPWKRLTTYSVPAAMPACPEDGCHCAWGWIPKGCGQPNMYHVAYKCKVTGATATTAIGPGQPPVWCEDDPSKCVKGPKQMLYWNQFDGNNIDVSVEDLSGAPKSPAYNAKCGFDDGAQDDIFTGPSTVPSPGDEPSSETPTSAAAATSTATDSPSSSSDTEVSQTTSAEQTSSATSSSSAAATPSASGPPPDTDVTDDVNGGQPSTGPDNTDAANPGTSELDSTNSGSANPSSSNSGSTNSGSTNSGSTKSDSTNPGSTNSGSTNPGSNNPGSTNSGSTNSGSDNPGSTNPGSTNSEFTASDNTSSSTTTSTVATGTSTVPPTITTVVRNGTSVKCKQRPPPPPRRRAFHRHRRTTSW